MNLYETLVLTAQGYGVNGAGAVSVPGAKVGDLVIARRSSEDQVHIGTLMEASVSVNNQVQQTSASNLTSEIVTFFLFRQEVVVASI